MSPGKNVLKKENNRKILVEKAENDWLLEKPLPDATSKNKNEEEKMNEKRRKKVKRQERKKKDRKEHR